MQMKSKYTKTLRMLKRQFQSNACVQLQRKISISFVYKDNAMDKTGNQFYSQQSQKFQA